MCKDNKNAATSSFSHHTFCMPDSTTVDRIEAMEGHPEIVRDTQSKKLTARDMTKTLVVN